MKFYSTKDGVVLNIDRILYMFPVYNDKNTKILCFRIMYGGGISPAHIEISNTDATYIMAILKSEGRVVECQEIANNVKEK